MSVEASPVYLTIQWKDLPAAIRITDHADGAIRSGWLHDGGLDENWQVFPRDEGAKVFQEGQDFGLRGRDKLRSRRA